MNVMKTFALLLLSAALALAADVTGTWSGNVTLTAGSGTPKMEFKQNGEALTGTYHGTFGDAPLTGTVKGDKIEFKFGNDQTQAKYSGTISGDKMSGTVDYGELGNGTFELSKSK
jgi:hypothetical protein